MGEVQAQFPADGVGGTTVDGIAVRSQIAGISSPVIAALVSALPCVRGGASPVPQPGPWANAIAARKLRKALIVFCHRFVMRRVSNQGFNIPALFAGVQAFLVPAEAPAAHLLSVAAVVSRWAVVVPAWRRQFNALALTLAVVSVSAGPRLPNRPFSPSGTK